MGDTDSAKRHLRCVDPRGAKHLTAGQTYLGTLVDEDNVLVGNDVGQIISYPLTAFEPVDPPYTPEYGDRVVYRGADDWTVQSVAGTRAKISRELPRGSADYEEAAVPVAMLERYQPPYEPAVGDIITSRLVGGAYVVVETGKTKYGSFECRNYETGRVVPGVRAIKLSKNGRGNESVIAIHHVLPLRHQTEKLDEVTR